jgi:CheY-like chemotaxis protein
MGKGRVLVVDDSAMVRRAIVLTLSSSAELEALVGDVLEACDGTSALRIMAESQPDLVLCDLVMPGFDGLKVLRARVGHPELLAIPVIMLTGEADRDRQTELFDAGAADCVAKPFEEHELVSRVGTYLRARVAREPAV